MPKDAPVTDQLAKFRRLEEAVRRLKTADSTRGLHQRIVDLVADAFRMDICALFVVDRPGHAVIAAKHDYPVARPLTEITFEQGLIGWVASHGEPLLVPDVRAERRYLKGIEGTCSELAVPLLVDQAVIGVLDLQSREIGAFDEFDQRLLSLFAAFAAALLTATEQAADRDRRLAELDAQASRFALIHRVGQTLIEGPSLEAAMQRVVDMVATTLGYCQTATLLYDPEFEELEVISAYGYGDVQGLRIPVSQGATGYAVRHGEPVTIGDVTNDPRYVKGIRCGRSELAVPIFRGERVLGVLDVESPQLDAFSAEDVTLLQVVGAYASAAISAARSEDCLGRERALRQRLELEVRLLGKVSQAMTLIADPDLLFGEILKLAGEVLRFDRCAVLLVDPERGRLEVRHGAGGGRPAQGQDELAEQVARRGEPAHRAGDGTTAAKMAVPLRAGGEILGVLALESDHRDFSRDDLDLFAAFGNHVSLALAASRLRSDAVRQLRSLDERARRLDLLNRVASSLTRRMTIDELLDELLRLCSEAFDISHCAVLLLDPQAGATAELVLRAAIGYASAPRRLEVAQGVTGHVVTSGVPVLVPDVSKDPRYVTGIAGGRSEMAAPLRVFDRIIGVLDAESAEIDAFDEEDLDLFTSFAAQAAVAIHNAKLQERLDALAERG